MAPRSIWNGTVSVGAVNIPVKLHSATESKTVRFRQVHLADGAAIEHRRFCSAENREVPYSEVVKGHEIGDGEYVVLEKEEIAAAAGARTRMIDVEDFVDAAAIDPVFFDKAYYLGAREGGEDGYAVLHAALEKTGRAGIGRFTFHNREYLVAIRALDDVLALHTMRFAEEVVAGGTLEAETPQKAPSEREIKMAGALVTSLHEDFEPEQYADEYREAVLEVIKRKAAGEELEREEPEAPAEDDDLLAALQASLDAGKGG